MNLKADGCCFKKGIHLIKGKKNLKHNELDLLCTAALNAASMQRTLKL